MKYHSKPAGRARPGGQAGVPARRCWNFRAALAVPGFLCFLPFGIALPAGAAERPNIVIIMADDLGYEDLGGAWGGQARTPHLDRLAAEGIRLTDYHSNAPVCSPTRAALMTGRYQQRFGIMKALTCEFDTSPEAFGIATHDPKEITLASYLRAAGYATGVFGKWHLGTHPTANPIRHGFDEFRGLVTGDGDYFSKLSRFGEADWWNGETREFQEGHATRVTSDNAVDFIDRHAGNPFFLYVPYSAIHFPWQSEDDADLPVRREGRAVTLPGEVPKAGPHLAPEAPRVARQMIEEIDDGVGRLLDTLRCRGLERKTLVIFMSDNGGYHRYRIKDRTAAISSNGPLRGGKTEVYEGGHRVPFIARWPGTIAAGRVSGTTAMSMDLLPTALDLAGISPPPPEGANRLDGVSLASLLLRDEAPPARTFFWTSPPGRVGVPRRAVRRGPWKLVEAELYRLDDDPGETRDLARQHPEQVNELRAALEAWEKDVGLSHRPLGVADRRDR